MSTESYPMTTKLDEVPERYRGLQFEILYEYFY